MRNTLWVVGLVSMSFSACSGEDGDGADVPADTDTDTDADTDTDTDTDADTETDVWLDRSHSGWRAAECWDCHTEDDHNAELLPHECVSCHGTNGAWEGHTTAEPCSRCHGEPHGEGFPDPESCTTCHESP